MKEKEKITNNASNTRTTIMFEVIVRNVLLVASVAHFLLHDAATFAIEEAWRLKNTVATGEFDGNTRAIFIFLTIQEKPYRFLVDTGSTKTILNRELKTLVGRKMPSVMVLTPSQRREEEFYAAPEVRFSSGGTLSLDQVGLVDLSFLSGALGKKVDGVLGFDAIRQFITDFDADHGKVRIALNMVGTPGGEVKKMVIKNGTPRISVSLGSGEPVLMLFDSGRIGSLSLSSSTEKELMSSDTITRTSQSWVDDYSGEGAREVNVGRATLRIGKEPLPPLVWRTGRQSALGVYVIARYRVVIDGPGDKIYFEPGKRFYVKDHSDMDGLVCTDMDERGLLVGAIHPDCLASKSGIVSGDRIVQVGAARAPRLSWISAMNVFALEREGALMVRIQRANKDVVVYLPE
jgi:hypothetical protein